MRKLPLLAASTGLQLGIGNVMHARFRPILNHFIYPVFCLRIAINQLPLLRERSNWIFGFNRNRPIAFFEQDHGDQSGDLKTWLKQQLAMAALDMPDGDIWLQTFPRVFGYVFNPVSFWYLHAADGSLRTILAEVNNTFGEHHQYLLTGENGAGITTDTNLTCRKVFHVSPFCEIKGYYKFRYQNQAEKYVMSIDYFEDDEPIDPLIATKISYRIMPPTASNMVKTLLKMPMLTFGIVFRIHWQALKLWYKKVPYIPKPQPPLDELTQNHRNPRHED